MAIDGAGTLGGILTGYKSRLANADNNTYARDPRMNFIFNAMGGKKINLNVDSSVHGNRLDIQEGNIPE